MILAFIAAIAVFFLVLIGPVALAALNFITSNVYKINALSLLLRQIQKSAFFRDKTQYTKQSHIEKMSLEDAADILCVSVNASDSDIETSFKKMIKINHPDKGGSKYLTKKLIEARELLLQRSKSK